MSEHVTQTVYCIREWDARYEVNNRNRAWVEGEEKRRGGLDFVRMPVGGHSISKGFRRLNKLAGNDAPAVLGVFVKLLEIAADNESHLRGYIIETSGHPMTAADIAETLDWDVSVIETALKVLCDSRLEWLYQVDFATLSREFPGIPGISTPRSETDHKQKQKQISRRSGSRGRAGDSALGSASADSDSAQDPAPEPAPTQPSTDDPPATDPTEQYLAAAGVPTQPDAEEPRRALNRLWTRIRKTTGDGPVWMAWWTDALPVITEADPVHAALLDALAYADDCADEAKRAAKGIGEPLKRPGGYVLSKTLEAARSAHVSLPELPTAKAPARTPAGATA